MTVSSGSFGGLAAKCGGFVDHTAKHPSNLATFFNKALVTIRLDSVACQSSIQPVLSFSLFRVCVCEFADEMGLIPPFVPCLSQVCSDRAR